jgi:hypothetical protein
MSWLLYELSRHPEQQQRIREEVKQARSKRGLGNSLQLEDLDALPFLNAAIKVVQHFGSLKTVGSQNFQGNPAFTYNHHMFTPRGWQGRCHSFGQAH